MLYIKVYHGPAALNANKHILLLRTILEKCDKHWTLSEERSISDNYYFAVY